MTTAPAAVHVTGAASIRVLGQVAGPRRVAKVLHAGRDAVYVDLDGSCLAVLADGAVQVPCGVRTSLPALPPVGPDAVAVVVDGSVGLPGCDVTVTRVVDTTVPVLDRAGAAWGARHLERHRASLFGTGRSLPTDRLQRLGAGDPEAVVGLLGLGPGLTPLGDDVLCGWLAAAVASRHPALDDLRGVVALQAPRRTTTLSTTLLACAARGEAVPEFLGLLTGIASRDVDAVERRVEAVLRIGDSSGAGMLLGALLALGGTP